MLDHHLKHVYVPFPVKNVFVNSSFRVVFAYYFCEKGEDKNTPGVLP